MRGAEHSGSYLPEDVTFFLKVVDQEEISVADKEVLIQSGLRHYSEFTTREHIPSSEYFKLYYEALRYNGLRLARDILVLAKEISNNCSGQICLVSLARAGTPIGILLRRALVHFYGRETFHASISIIAGRGIDANALDEIRYCANVPDASIFFVDGWTGKGVISRELKASINHYNQQRGASLRSALYVISDLCNSADYSATKEDYLIPSCLLGAIVSGLISRSILNDQVVGPTDYHACRFYRHLSQDDKSREFVDEIFVRMREVFCEQASSATPLSAELPKDYRSAHDTLEMWQKAFGLSSLSLVKPGIGEATRVLLRRVPEVLIVRDRRDLQVAPTLQLASEKGVRIIIDADLPWSALAIIKETR